MLALIAGTGDLPPALVARLEQPPLICALHGFTPAVTPEITFRLEQLGSFLQNLSARGVTRICMAGAVRRPEIDPAQIDTATLPLVPKIQTAMAQGDDGALRVIIALMEDAGFSVVAAHEIAPDLLPTTGVLTQAAPEDWHRADAAEGEACVAAMGATDTGQACIVRMGSVLVTEDSRGTDAMLRGFQGGIARRVDPYDWLVESDNLYDFELGITNRLKDLVDRARLRFLGHRKDDPVSDDGILFKGPKPDQDRRADLPLIGPMTAMGAAEAGLSGIVVEAKGVMILQLDTVCQILDAQGMFLWVRPRGDL